MGRLAKEKTASGRAKAKMAEEAMADPAAGGHAHVHDDAVAKARAWSACAR